MTDKKSCKLKAKLPEGSRILCAVSGGADSMCLLHMLMEEKDRLGIEVAVAHFEHGLRGQESLRDAEFVLNYCKDKGIECVLEHGDVKAFAKEKGFSIEEAARELRYAFLQRAAEKLRCDYIATAHNADDNAETMLFNLCRGSGAAGLCGIPPKRDNIIRPLLDMSRAEIEACLEEYSVPHVEDSSNAADDYSRNLIRHHVSPVLRQINPAFAEAAGRTARLLRQDEDCLDGMAQSFIDKHYDGESLSQSELAKLHKAIGSRVFRKLWPFTLGIEHVDALMKLLEGTELSYADIPGGRIRRERGRIYFKEDCCDTIVDRVLPVDSTVDVPEAGIKIHSFLDKYGTEVYGLFNNFAVKYENIRGDVYCTARRDGDRMRPVGRKCSKSLKSLFNEKKMTAAQKNLCPVIRDDEGILAVYGIAADERAKAAPGDKVLRIVIEKY